MSHHSPSHKLERHISGKFVTITDNNTVPPSSELYSLHGFISQTLSVAGLQWCLNHSVPCSSLGESPWPCFYCAMKLSQIWALIFNHFAKMSQDTQVWVRTWNSKMSHSRGSSLLWSHYFISSSFKPIMSLHGELSNKRHLLLNTKGDRQG